MPRPVIPRTRWLQSQNPPPLWQQAKWRHTLQLPGSLTRRLKRLAQGSFRVEILNEHFGIPSRDEAELLAIPHRQRAWLREVALHVHGEACVVARTVMPLTLLRGPQRHLRCLGRKPLGEYLFQRHDWQRSHFQIGQCVNTPNNMPTPAWARRSCFQNASQRLLVCEYFHYPLP